MLIYMGIILLISIIIGIIDHKKHTNIKMQITGKDIHNRKSILNMQDKRLK